MSVYQKASILLVRLHAFVIFIYGLMGLAVRGYLGVAGEADPYSHERLAASIVYLVIGVVGMLISQQLGKWLGRGLG